jgi:acetamidase/formamidase
VFVPGANFSAGDGHAVQGDGEVCLTALETCLRGTFEFVLHKKMSLELPRAVTPTHLISMGLDTDLDDAAKQALREMIKWLVSLKGWTAEEAYVFCSLACDLRVTQLVDGNKGIHAMVDRSLL